MQEKLIEEKIKSLNKIKVDFQQFQHRFWEIEIILDDSLIKEINAFLTKYIQITSKLSRSNIEQQLRVHEQSFDSWEDSFRIASSDLVDIKNKLKEEFRKVLKN